MPPGGGGGVEAEYTPDFGWSQCMGAYVGYSRLFNHQYIGYANYVLIKIGKYIHLDGKCNKNRNRFNKLLTCIYYNWFVSDWPKLAFNSTFLYSIYVYLIKDLLLATSKQIICCQRTNICFKLRKSKIITWI